MKKTLIKKISNQVPQELQHFIADADIYDSSSSPEARVYFIDKDGGYYLKCAKTGMLEKEAKMTQYFYSKVLFQSSGRYLTSRTRTSHNP